MNKLEQFVQSEHPRKIARMEPTSSNQKRDILNEIIKPKSLSELHMKRNHDKDEDDDDAYEQENDDEEDDAYNEQENDEENKNPESQSVKFLLTSRVGLENRFKKLFHEFTNEKKLENRTELVFLLDEMLRQKYITPEEYESFNNGYSYIRT